MERELLPNEPWLRRYLIHLSCRDCDIDDVVQECFLRIYAAASIERVPNPRALLRRVAHNLMIDRYRRRRSVEYVGIDAALDLPAANCPADELIDLRRTLARVVNAVNAFPERRREIVERRCIAGQSSKEAAAELGICSSAVDKHLRASLKLLRYARDGASGEYIDA